MVEIIVVVVVVVVVKVPVWDAAIIGMVVVVEVLVIDVLVGVEFIEVGVVVIVLKFALSASCSVNVPPDVTVDWFMDVLTGVMFGVLTRICIDVLAGMNANAFAVPVSTSFEGFSR